MFGCKCFRGPDQIPWDGKLNYDYQLWIDSDIVFSTEKFSATDLHFLFDAVDENGETVEGKDHPISAGWYSTEDGRNTSVTHWLEEDDFRNNGGVMNHEMVDGISKGRKPFTVDYTGFGWVLIKNGVFENEQMKILGSHPRCRCLSLKCSDMCGEDVSFCLDAIGFGWCDPRIRVGHEKTLLFESRGVI